MAWELLSEVNLENSTITCSYSQLIQDWLQSPNYLQRANYEWQSVGGNISFSDSILMFRPNSGSDYQTINFDSHFKCIWDSSGITFKLDETTVFYTSQGFNFYNSDYNHNAICIMVDTNCKLHELPSYLILIIKVRYLLNDIQLYGLMGNMMTIAVYYIVI